MFSSDSGETWNRTKSPDFQTQLHPIISASIPGITCLAKHNCNVPLSHTAKWRNILCQARGCTLTSGVTQIVYTEHGPYISGFQRTVALFCLALFPYSAMVVTKAVQKENKYKTERNEGMPEKETVMMKAEHRKGSANQKKALGFQNIFTSKNDGWY